MRLIDADELIKRMRKWMPKDPCGREQTVEEVVATDIVASVFMEIEETPTAFDKEDVIEELENLRAQYFITIANTGDEKLGFAYKYIWNALDHAIKIVEKGGIQ